MDNKEVKELVESFRAYRDMLVPVQKNLNDFVDTYDIMRENIDKLNTAFEGDVKGKMEELFRQMSAQAAKSASLSERIDKLTEATREFQKLFNSFSTLEKLVTSVNSLERRAEEQISKLDEAVSVKTKTYNIKGIEQSLNSFLDTHAQIGAIHGSLDSIVKTQNDDSVTLVKLLESYKASGDFLKKITESKDVNEAYLFDILDKWADSRKLKIKN